MAMASCCRTIDASDVPDGWSTCEVAYRASLDGPPFWLPLDIAQSLPSCARPGFDFIPEQSKIQPMPFVWVSRADAEAAAERVHGAAGLAERRAAAAARVHAACAASASANGTLILLHGTGDSGLSLGAAVEGAGLFEGARARGLALRCPDAPLRRLGFWGDAEVRVWHDRRCSQPRADDGAVRWRDSARDVAAACARLARLARRARAPVFVVGHSMGGVLALHAAARVRALAGVACFAAWLPADSPTFARLRRRGRAAAPRVLLAYGARDDMMPVEKQRRTAARLEADARDGGAPFECCVLRDTDHHVTAAHVGALFRWIDEAVALGARV